MAFPIALVAGMAAAGMQAHSQNQREKRAKQNQFDIMKEQMYNQKQLDEHGANLQYDLWKKTNYSAQMDEMRKAGLNPSMMYGMGGAGGATTGSQSGGQAQGGQAPQPQQIDIAGAMQVGLMKAQKDNIEADTANKKADAIQKGVQTDSAGIDLEIKQRLGLDALERKAQIEMQSANATDAKNIREINAWMDEAFKGSDAMGQDGSIEIRKDKYGSYATGDNVMARKMIRAGLETTIQELNNLKSTGSNLDQQGQIMKAEKIIKDFEAGLTDVGLNGVSGQILTKLLHIIFSK